MIGWKCNCGAGIYRPSDYKNLSDITIYDVDRYWCIPEFYSTEEIGEIETGKEPTGSEYIEYGKAYVFPYADSIFNNVLNTFGDDSYYLYGTYWNLPREYFELYSEQDHINFPNALNMFPKTSEHLAQQYLNNEEMDTSIYVLPTLKRVLMGSYIGIINSDNSITWKSYSGISMINGYGFRSFFMCVLKKENGWKNIENYYRLYSQTKITNNTKGGILFSKINSTSSTINYIQTLFSENVPPDVVEIVPPNPYEPGGPSGPTDPNLPPGTFDDESDPIPDSSLPTISAANTGFTRIYNPTLSQVQALARYLWTDETVIQTIWNHIKQFFENPMDAIIGFNLVPVPVPDGGTQNFALMYIDTGVSMTVAANQFVDMDCGTLKLERYYGSALDQSPYTKVSCFLPYIGTVNLNTDEVMGTTLQVKYRVDIVSGSCVAKIFVDGNCLYQYSGHCAITIPISSADFSSYVSAAISVGKLAAAAITAGAGAAMAAGVVDASQQTNQVVTTTQVTNTARNPSTGRQITTGTTTTVQTRESPADQSSTQASFSGLSPQNVANTVGAIMSSKPHIEHSGSFSGNSGYLGVRRPFLIIERPNMCMPANYQALNGFPAMITMELSTCKGFTRVQQVQLTGMGRATNPEQAEILELLKSGVIL